MKTLTSKKVIWLLLVTVLFLLFFYFHVANFPSKVMIQPKQEHDVLPFTSDSIVNARVENVSDDNNKDDMKYILLWTSAKTVPFTYIGVGQKGFVERKCPYTNCFVTGNKNHLKDITKFDVVAFSGPEVIRMTNDKLPKARSQHQKYVFASIESSGYYPVCSDRFNNYFNWTWTFRLDSDVRWGYMVIKDKENNIVGPNKVMHWIKHEDMDPVNDEFKEQLKSKSKAAAWFVSNCRSKSNREHFVKELQKELMKFNLTVDVYGSCGPLKCSRDKEGECFNLIKEKYYFYLSFENSFSEDYVTEKLLNAVWNDAVPIVYGSANYSRSDSEYETSQCAPVVEKASTSKKAATKRKSSSKTPSDSKSRASTSSKSDCAVADLFDEPKPRASTSKDDLFGLEGAFEVPSPAARSPVASSLVIRVANGKVRRTADVSGDFFVELKVYCTKEIADTPRQERWKKAQVALKLQLSRDSTYWNELQKFVRRSHEAFASSEACYFSDNIHFS